MENEGVSVVSFKSRDELLRKLCMRVFGYLPAFDEDTKLKQSGAVAICKAGYVEELEDRIRRVREIVGRSKDHLAGSPTQNTQLIRGILDSITTAVEN